MNAEGQKRSQHHATRGETLELNSVSYRYGTQAAPSNRGSAGLGPLNVKVGAGEFVTVVGPSGGGKSTLLGVLAGFLKPQSGEVKLGGQVVRGPDPRLTLMQQEHALFPWLTVGGNVAFGLSKASNAAREQRVQDALKQVGLPGYAQRRVHELSGGQRQRVSLARALATQPGLLLLDEPFSALDERTRLDLSDELRAIWWEQRITVVFVTHHLREALNLGQRVLALRGGEVVLDTPSKGLSAAQLRATLEHA